MWCSGHQQIFRDGSKPLGHHKGNEAGPKRTLQEAIILRPRISFGPDNGPEEVSVEALEAKRMQTNWRREKNEPGKESAPRDRGPDTSL